MNDQCLDNVIQAGTHVMNDLSGENRKAKRELGITECHERIFESVIFEFANYLKLGDAELKERVKFGGKTMDRLFCTI